MTAASFNRRSFLRAGTFGLTGAMGAGLRAQTSAGVTLSPYVADVDGDGQIVGAADTQLMQRALFTSRGFALEANIGFDYRADVFGRARVDQEALDTVADDGMRQNLAFFDGNSDGASTPKNWSESSRYSRGRPGRPRVMRLREQ